MMMDVNTIGQMLRDSKMTGNLQRQSLTAGHGLGGGRRASGILTASGQASGFPGLGAGNSATGFQDLVAIAQAQAELSAQSAMSSGPVNQETARSLAQIRAMSVQSEMMLSGLGGLESGGEGRALNLVGQANLEAAMMNTNSGHFGNLLGQRGGQPVLDTGRKLSPSEMTSLQQKVRGLKSGPLRRNAVSAENSLESKESGEANLRMPYGLNRPPHREQTAASIAADLDHWIEDPLKGLDQTQLAQAAANRASAGAAAKIPSAPNIEMAQGQMDGPLKSESEILAAQKKDATSGLEGGYSREELDKLVDKVSLALGLDRNLVMAVIKTESNFNHKAVSRAGAKGLMQLMPGTAKDLGVADPFNPVENVWAGARYLKKMLDRHGGNINKALASYNWGPGNFDRYGKSGKLPNETRRYISTVNQYYASFKKADSDQA